MICLKDVWLFPLEIGCTVLLGVELHGKVVHYRPTFVKVDVARPVEDLSDANERLGSIEEASRSLQAVSG